jgi:hypothetical protein
MSHGGKRPGAGRPKEKSWQQVAVDLSAPADWPDYAPPVSSLGAGEPAPKGAAAYRPSKASAVRSGIPAAAYRIQQLEVKAGRPRRSISEIEKELVDKAHADTANKTTSSAFRSKSIQAFLAAESDAIRSGAIDGFSHPSVARVRVDGELRESGCSMSDFVFERFFDGTMQPTEIRGLRWTR